jgi:hypothetical protein
MLMGPHHGAVHRDDLPVYGSDLIGLPLKRLEDPFPDACPPPVHEAVIAGLPGTVALGHVPPRRARAKAPEDAVDHFAMVFVRMAPLSIRRGQERPEPFILGVG